MDQSVLESRKKANPFPSLACEKREIVYLTLFMLAGKERKKEKKTKNGKFC